MRRPQAKAILAALVLAATAGAKLAAASEGQEDHEIARSALLRGEVMPVQDIVDAARTMVGDDLLGLELEREDDRWIYEIKYVDDSGHVRTINLDAHTGKQIEGESD
jgi:uncharacterized membrane protein YkoI